MFNYKSITVHTTTFGGKNLKSINSMASISMAKSLRNRFWTNFYKNFLTFLPQKNTTNFLFFKLASRGPRYINIIDKYEDKKTEYCCLSLQNHVYQEFLYFWLSFLYSSLGFCAHEDVIKARFKKCSDDFFTLPVEISKKCFYHNFSSLFQLRWW